MSKFSLTQQFCVIGANKMRDRKETEEIVGHEEDRQQAGIDAAVPYIESPVFGETYTEHLSIQEAFKEELEKAEGSLHAEDLEETEWKKPPWENPLVQGIISDTLEQYGHTFGEEVTPKSAQSSPEIHNAFRITPLAGAVLDDIRNNTQHGGLCT